jgi:hypothetical protein
MFTHQKGRVRIVHQVSAQMGNLLNDFGSHISIHSRAAQRLDVQVSF